MELYDHILQSDDFEALANTHKYTLKKEHRLLDKTMTGILMTMHYGDSTYEKELSLLQEKLDKIDTCLALTHKKRK